MPRIAARQKPTRGRARSAHRLIEYRWIYIIILNQDIVTCAIYTDVAGFSDTIRICRAGELIRTINGEHDMS